jgi:integrase
MRASGERWHAHWRDGAGVQHEKVLGKVWSRRGRPAEGYLTKQGAQQLLDELLVGARKVGPRAARGAHDASFADACAEWLRYVQHDRRRRPSTMRDYTGIVERELEPVFGAVPLRAISSELIDSYRTHLLAEGRLAPRTINKYLLVLHAIFKRAQRHYGLTVNPVAGVERQPVRRPSEFRVLTPEEVAALAAHAADEQDAAIYTTAAYAGLRLGELRALRWRDVDFELRVIHVRRSYTLDSESTPKSGRARAVPLVDQVAGALEQLSRREALTGPEDLVFPSPAGGHLEDSALRRRYYKALAAAGIEHLRFHDLRHTFGTLAVQEFALSDVKAYMGHADIATTMIYVHHVPQHDAANRLSRRLAKTASRQRVP